jgi:hypothetical protein
MSRPDQHTRRGIALLLALATLVLVLAGMAASLAALHGARQSAWSSSVDAHLLAGLRQGELLATAWLTANGDAVVLPPEGGGIPLVDDRFLLPEGSGRLTVVAYDGCAGLPVGLAQRGDALRLSLSGPLLDLDIPASEPAVASRLLDSLALPDGLSRYPQPGLGAGRPWRDGPAQATPGATRQPAGGTSLAEAISFHSDGGINLNTAPAPLLRAAYARLGLPGVEALLERRRMLQPTTPPSAALRVDGLRLLAASECWQMLIRVEWQGVARTWWVVFAGKSRIFSMVQRHDASD